MKLVIGTIPFDSTRLAGWLERAMTGAAFGDLIDELRVLHAPEPAFDFRAWFARHGDTILQQGLGAVRRAELRKLLQHPSALAALQERVLLDGGPYWDAVIRRVPAESPSEPPAEPPVVDLMLVASPRPSARPARPARPQAPVARRRWPEWAVALTTAAVVLLGVFLALGLVERPASAAWGWGRGMPTETDPTAYREKLAALADQWTDARPDTAPALLERLLEFRSHCGLLQAADHAPLTAGQRADLRKRCRNWSGKIDDAIERLKTGTADPLAIRAEMDAMVATLADAIRTKLPAG